MHLLSNWACLRRGYPWSYRAKKSSLFERAHDIGRRLGLDAKSLEQFILLVQTDSASDTVLKADLQKKLCELQNGRAIFDLSVDQFKVIADWYGFAILVMFTDMDQAYARKDAAKSLGISLQEVDATLERLQRLELIERSGGTNECPRFIRPKEPILVEARKPNEAIRSYYKSMLPKCLESIDSQTPDEKVIGAQTMAFDPTQMNAVRKLTDDYLDALNLLASRGKKRTEVYQAFCNFFKLTQNQTQDKRGRK